MFLFPGQALLKLGTSKREAILTALSRKGYWRLARTLATHTGMTIQWLKEQGLISVKELWVNIHPPRADSLPSYGSVDSVSRPLLTRMRGGVAATRLAECIATWRL